MARTWYVWGFLSRGHWRTTAGRSSPGFFFGCCTGNQWWWHENTWGHSAPVKCCKCTVPWQITTPAQPSDHLPVTHPTQKGNVPDLQPTVVLQLILLTPSLRGLSPATPLPQTHQTWTRCTLGLQHAQAPQLSLHSCFSGHQLGMLVPQSCFMLTKQLQANTNLGKPEISLSSNELQVHFSQQGLQP